MYKRIKCYFIFLISLNLNISAQTLELREWQFAKGNAGGIWEAIRSNFAMDWQDISVPHCFNAFDVVDHDIAYFQGEGWYKTFLEINNPYKNGRTVLHFEGIGQKSTIYIYNKQIHKHTGGYNEFIVDITDAVNQFTMSNEFADFGKKVPLIVVADNSRDLQMIPSDMSDFPIYGGIYRRAYLKYLPHVSVSNIKIQTELLNDGQKANAAIKVNFYNPQKIFEESLLSISIIDPAGNLIEKQSELVNSLDKDISLSFLVKNPLLWSPSDPRIYTVKVVLETSGEVSSYVEKFGFRSFEFKKHGPFLLNGERLLIKGTHRHEDQAGFGAAEPDSLVRKELILIKEMGANFVRLGHYQQSEFVLDLCDSLGLLVWEEIPWCRGGLGGINYQKQAIEMLKDMITQHFNHPSIIIWGLGNEIDWQGDFPEFNQDSIRAFMLELNGLAHKLDPIRKTGIRRCAFCSDIVDVYSPSIWAGWYSGKFTEYKSACFREMQKVDHFIHMEWGGSSYTYRHSEDPDVGLENIRINGEVAEKNDDFLMEGGEARVSRDGSWSTSYMVNLIDWTLKEQETMDWLTGSAAWVFKDYPTPLRPQNPIPFVNQKGVLERDLKLKESYYVFQSYWAKKPMVHIYGSTWDTRWGEEGESKMLKVYSNCDLVELFLNDISLGIKERNSQNFPAAGLRWKSPLKKGKNTLKAIGKKSGEIVVDEIHFNYQTEKWGEPNKLVLTKLEDRLDTVTVEVRLLDQNDVQCLNASNFLRFGITGDGLLIDNLGTSDASSYLQMYNGRAIIRIRKNNGESVASVKAEGLPTAFLRIK